MSMGTSRGRLHDRRLWYSFVLVSLVLLVGGCDGDSDDRQEFTVRMENVSPEFTSSGVFNTPVGAEDPGVIMPGQAYAVTFSAARGYYLSFATMFVPSNDLFFAPDEDGIALFEDNMPVTGNVTAQVMPWDAGTEVNQDLGLGADQAPRQDGPDTGALDSDATVRLATEDNIDNLPSTEDVIRVTLSVPESSSDECRDLAAPPSDTCFTLRIENVSDANTLTTSRGDGQAVPLSPGVFVIHRPAAAPLFTVGEPDRGNGLEALAEDGMPAELAETLASRTSRIGVVVPLSPGVAVVHTVSNPLFTVDEPDRGNGLEALAEDGNPMQLGEFLDMRPDGIESSRIFDTPVGVNAPSPIQPGQAYEFTVRADPGDALSFATMFVPSNDYFFAPDGDGIELFNADEMPVEGDVTDQVMLWDAGTEVNQPPGRGADQAPNQGMANTGADDPINRVRLTTNPDLPETENVIRVTVTPQ